MKKNFFVPSWSIMPSRPTLAIADDDEIHSELLAAWLEHHGYQVLRFESGDRLVDWASHGGGEVAAFVLDVDMPGRDGFESCRELKRLPAYAAVPAVFVSSLTGEAAERRASDAGGSGPVRKDAEMFPRLATWLAENVRVWL